MKKVFVTGASGYIGSHTVVSLLDHGYDVTGVDNFSNSNPSVVDAIRTISKKKFNFYEIDLLNKHDLGGLFINHKYDVIIHFAGLKSVNESILFPEKYFSENLEMLNNLLVLKDQSTDFIFSSTASVYDPSHKPPFKEDDPTKPSTPYGICKLLSEKILESVSPLRNFKTICLRYFNPLGAHPSGLMGEMPTVFPNNLMPYLLDVAASERPFLSIFGNDYSTPDGTGCRDFIHILDLAEGHVSAIDYLNKIKHNFEVINLGTGSYTSVMQLVNSFEQVNNIKIPYKIAPRREGDSAISYANITKALQLLNWKPKYGLKEMCQDAWHWKKTKNK